MQYGILGPLEVRLDGRPIPVARPRRQALLAFLLLHAGRTVSAPRLIEALWADAPPTTARAQIHTAVSALRTQLPPAFAAALSSDASGYRLAAGAEDLDASVFAARLATARQLAGEQPERAVRLLREGLQLWRGPALASVDAPFAEAARTGLEEQRFAAHELLADLGLRAGRAAELVPLLTALLAEHPTREPIAERLAVALYRCGRQTDALAVLRRLRAVLAEEYGVDPGERLAALELAVLRQDPALTPATVTATPATVTATPAATPAVLLPAPLAAAAAPARPPLPRPAQCPDRSARFVGRLRELAALDQLFEDSSDTRVVALTGPAGIGKTALALHWARSRPDAFPDGHLYADLHGWDAAEPECPSAVLEHFLTALGVPGEQLPPGLARREALYRSLLAERRVLVVLDNARDHQQLRPLLPGPTPGLTVVTSRDRLAGLAVETGAQPLPLTVLTPAESQAALECMVGPDRLRAESVPARRLAELCGHLPLALRIAAARLAVDPAATVSGLVTELTPEAGRLAALSLDGLGVCQALDHSYRRLTDDQIGLLQLLARHPGGTTPPPGPALRGLEARHLVEHLGLGRYALHPLVALYTRRLKATTAAARTGLVPPPRRPVAPGAGRSLRYAISSARPGWQRSTAAADPASPTGRRPGR